MRVDFCDYYCSVPLASKEIFNVVTGAQYSEISHYIGLVPTCTLFRDYQDGFDLKLMMFILVSISNNA